MAESKKIALDALLNDESSYSGLYTKLQRHYEFDEQSYIYCSKKEKNGSYTLYNRRKKKFVDFKMSSTEDFKNHFLNVDNLFQKHEYNNGKNQEDFIEIITAPSHYKLSDLTNHITDMPKNEKSSYLQRLNNQIKGFKKLVGSMNIYNALQIIKFLDIQIIEYNDYDMNKKLRKLETIYEWMNRDISHFSCLEKETRTKILRDQPHLLVFFNMIVSLINCNPGIFNPEIYENKESTNPWGIQFAADLYHEKSRKPGEKQTIASINDDITRLKKIAYGSNIFGGSRRMYVSASEMALRSQYLGDNILAQSDMSGGGENACSILENIHKDIKNLKNISGGIDPDLCREFENSIQQTCKLEKKLLEVYTAASRYIAEKRRLGEFVNEVLTKDILFKKYDEEISVLKKNLEENDSRTLLLMSKIGNLKRHPSM
jgi:hypothetical protein